MEITTSACVTSSCGLILTRGTSLQLFGGHIGFIATILEANIVFSILLGQISLIHSILYQMNVRIKDLLSQESEIVQNPDLVAAILKNGCHFGKWWNSGWPEVDYK